MGPRGIFKIPHVMSNFFDITRWVLCKIAQVAIHEVMPRYHEAQPSGIWA